MRVWPSRSYQASFTMPSSTARKRSSSPARSRFSKPGSKAASRSWQHPPRQTCSSSSSASPTSSRCGRRRWARACGCTSAASECEELLPAAGTVRRQDRPDALGIELLLDHVGLERRGVPRLHDVVVLPEGDLGVRVEAEDLALVLRLALVVLLPV